MAKMIDYTLLRPEATRNDITRICEEGKKFGFIAVCINPTWVPLASKLLKNSGVKVDTVIGFPFGATLPEVKVFEAETAILAGAEEIDMVVNFGALKSGDIVLVIKDIESVVDLSRKYGVISKVIIEVCYLTTEEKILACRLVKNGGADFIKTSTGFGSGGATVEDVKMLRENVGNNVGVKAAGGIRILEDVVRMVDAGASRIGTSSGIKIIESIPE